VGTGGTRALIVDERGKLIASATEEHAPFVSPKIGWAEQSPEDWWRACTIAVSGALARARLRGDDLACVGFSGQMHGAVMLDENDQVVVVSPALIWCDVRTEDQCQDLAGRIGAERLLSNLQFRAAELYSDQVEAPIAVQQELMRHADIRTTMNTYRDVVTDEMSRAASKVAGLALKRCECHCVD
jgi:sugar (pentulose or hexulose) kinase